MTDSGGKYSSRGFFPQRHNGILSVGASYEPADPTETKALSLAAEMFLLIFFFFFSISVLFLPFFFLSLSLSF